MTGITYRVGGSKLTHQQLDDNFSTLAERVQYVSVKEYGATGDGVTDDTTAIQNCFNENNYVYFPPGTYLCGIFTCSNATAICVKGAGKKATTIKRKNNNVVSDNIQKMAIFYLTGNGSYFFSEGITWDANGTNQPNAPEGDEYKYQQSHCVDVKADGADVGFVAVRNSHFEDCTADGLSLTERNDGTFGKIVLTGLTEGDRTYVRSGITLVANFDYCTVSDCIMDSFEIEHNAIDTENFNNALNMTNCFWSKKLDLNFKHADVSGIYPKLNLSNTSVGLGGTSDPEFLPLWLNIGNCDANISNCNFVVNRQVFIRGFYRMKNTRFHCDANWTGSNTLLEERSEDGGSLEVTVEGCRFTADAGAYTAGLRYFYENDNLVDEAATDYVGTRFINCHFNSTQIKTAYVRSGKFEFRNCIHDYDSATDACIVTGNFRGFADTFYVEHRLIGNHVTSSNSWLYQSPPTFNPASDGQGGYEGMPPPLNLHMDGNSSRSGRLLRLSDFTHLDQIDVDQFYGLGEDLRDQIIVKQLDQFVHFDDIPAKGHWVDGQIVKFNKMVDDSGTDRWGAVCTTRGTREPTATAVFSYL